MKEVLSCSTCFSADNFCSMQVVMNCIFLILSMFSSLRISCSDLWELFLNWFRVSVLPSCFFLNSYNVEPDNLINLSEFEMYSKNRLYFKKFLLQ